MFPYKIRKPAWGTLKPHEEPLLFDATCQLGGDPTDPHTIGGNLQRAILLDMIELRHRYCNAEEAAWTTAPTPHQQSCAHNNLTTNKSNHPIKAKCSHNHAALGSSFARFKDCFRNARFGAMHTRTIPPRVDRGEYVQLLYSSCFYLLEESFKSESNSQHLLRWDVFDTSHPNCAINTVYAIFILYTLHQTNVLPVAPPPRSQNANHHRIIDENLLKEAWSMLPIGINSDEDKLYRRKFRSPVRIDRWNYLLLLRLHDLCLAQVDECGMEASINATTDVRSRSIGSTFNNNAESWRCRCGLARDTAYIIDKMLFTDAFFEYCEYHGPHGLEGLGGSPNFYRAYFANPSTKKSKRTKTNDEVAMSVATLGSCELNKFGTDDDMPSSLELQNLVEEHCSNLTSVSSYLQKSRITGNELQPKQRELVESVLSEILDPSKYSELSEKVNGKEESNTNVFTGGEANIPDEELVPKTSEESLVSFPGTFSVAARTLLRESFVDFIEEAKRIRKAVVKETKALVRDKNSCTLEATIHSDVALFDDFFSIPESDSCTPITLEHQTKRPRKHDEFLELQQEDFDDDEFSTATGAGKNALLSLLSAGEGDKLPINVSLQDDEFSVATGAGKNALRALLSMAGGNNNSGDFDDESVASNDDHSGLVPAHNMSNNPIASLEIDDTASVVSGMGMRALNLLLSGQAKQQCVKNRARRGTLTSPPKKVRKSITTKIDNHIHSKKNQHQELPDDGSCARDDDEASSKVSASMGKSSDEEMSVVTEDAGRNALEKLLSNAN
jgi:hypothetical protein